MTKAHEIHHLEPPSLPPLDAPIPIPTPTPTPSPSWPRRTCFPVRFVPSHTRGVRGASAPSLQRLGREEELELFLGLCVLERRVAQAGGRGHGGGHHLHPGSPARRPRRVGRGRLGPLLRLQLGGTRAAGFQGLAGAGGAHGSPLHRLGRGILAGKVSEAVVDDARVHLQRDTQSPSQGQPTSYHDRRYVTTVTSNRQPRRRPTVCVLEVG